MRLFLHMPSSYEDEGLPKVLSCFPPLDTTDLRREKNK